MSEQKVTNEVMGNESDFIGCLRHFTKNIQGSNRRSTRRDLQLDEKSLRMNFVAALEEIYFRCIIHSSAVVLNDHNIM